VYSRFVKADVWPRGDAANELLLRLLELSRYFMSPQTRALALAHIKARSFYFRPAKLIEISYEYQTKTLFPAAFQHLATTSLRALRKEDVNMMGISVYVALARLKEAIQEHCCILAAEPPKFDPNGPRHHSTCIDNTACARDWHAVWWNGMGRFLLDGRNPLTWAESVKQFERLEIGEMNPLCHSTMITLVHEGEGNGHIYGLISAATDKLMGDVEIVPEEE
jgi:hypothetical protein